MADYKNMAVLTNLIRVWADQRELLKQDPHVQYMKLAEEMGELGNGILKDKQDQVFDSLGDIFIVLVILAEQLHYPLNDCVNAAYDVIRNRKGKLIDGTFVKEEDLNA